MPFNFNLTLNFLLLFSLKDITTSNFKASKATSQVSNIRDALLHLCRFLFAQYSSTYLLNFIFLFTFTFTTVRHLSNSTNQNVIIITITMYTNIYNAAAAVAALATVANGHMIMKTPKPFGGASLNNSPLTSSDFPCKLQGDPATFYSTEGLDNTMAVGETQSLSFTGSAVHGGGSCQLAITKDLAPSASTSWQVILSIEGGCPSKSGQGPDTYDFTIPDSVAAGQCKC